FCLSAISAEMRLSIWSVALTSGVLSTQATRARSCRSSVASPATAGPPSGLQRLVVQRTVRSIPLPADGERNLGERQVVAGAETADQIDDPDDGAVREHVEPGNALV